MDVLAVDALRMGVVIGGRASLYSWLASCAPVFA
jgi:hypothetical protein